MTKSRRLPGNPEVHDETNHVFLPAVVMASKRFWDRLSRDEQAIIQQSCDGVGRAYFRTTSRDLERKVVGELTAAGMTMNQIAPAEKPAWPRPRRRDRQVQRSSWARIWSTHPGPRSTRPAITTNWRKSPGHVRRVATTARSLPGRRR